MAIKNKDGSVYKLRGPNPLMKDQADWDKKKMNLINMGWEEEVVADARNPVKKFETDYNVVKMDEELGLIPNIEANATAVVPAKEFIEGIQETQVEDPVITEPTPVIPQMPDPPEEKKQPVLNVDVRLARMLRERGVEYYCAPAIGKKVHIDDLYGNTYETVQYGDKYVFDAVVIDQSDLQLQFWCVRPITEKSIIYRKIEEGGERWWRVREVEEKTGGYLAMANVSDSNPDFS
jgi:hypothetical protein